MDIFEVGRRIVRRWYVALPALLLAFGAAGFVYQASGTHYQASASVVLVGPSAASAAPDDAAGHCSVNPWCGGTNVVNLGHVTARTMSDSSVQRELLGPHPGATYEVELDRDKRSPIITLWVTAPSAGEALATLSDVRGTLERELADRQRSSGAAPESFIQPSTVTKATSPKPQGGGKMRATAATLALGLGLTSVAIVVADRTAKPRAAGASGDPARGGPPPEAPRPEADGVARTGEREPAGLGAS